MQEVYDFVVVGGAPAGLQFAREVVSRGDRTTPEIDLGLLDLARLYPFDPKDVRKLPTLMGHL